MATVTVRHRRFSVEDFHRMAEAGVLGEDDRVELIEGEVVEMAPIGSRHAACVAALNEGFGNCRGEALVWVQSPIRLSRDSEPQPDLALLKPRRDRYASGLPAPEDVLLVVEVAESSLAYDRDIKAPLYAQAGIPELWIVDIPNQVLEVHTQPGPKGYGLIRRCLPGESLTPNALPRCAIAVGEIFFVGGEPGI